MTFAFASAIITKHSANAYRGIAQLGAAVTYFAGPDGYVHDPDGVITDEKLNFILEMRAKDPMHCKPYADKFGCEFVAGEKCWGVKDVDVYMPAAMQNDVRMESAEKIAVSGVKYYIEVANMPTTNDALNFLRQQKGIIVAPSKAVNAGGVGVSAGDGSELRASGLDCRGSRCSAAQDDEDHPQGIRRCRCRVRSGLRPGGWRQHRRLQEGRRSYDGAGLLLSRTTDNDPITEPGVLRVQDPRFSLGMRC